MTNNIDQELLRDLSTLMESSRWNWNNADIEKIAMKMVLVRTTTDKILNRAAELEREKQRYIDRKYEEINSFLKRTNFSSLDMAYRCSGSDSPEKKEASRLSSYNLFDKQINQIEEQLRYYRDILNKLMAHTK